MNRDTRLSDVLHVLLHLSQADKPVTSDVLARSLGSNSAVFRRTMAGLRKGGYVRSEKGHGGGWQLNRPLEEIRLLDVYEALGRPNLFAIGNRNANAECLVEKSVNAALAETFSQAEGLFLRQFAQLSLASLVPKTPQSHPHPYALIS